MSFAHPIKRAQIALAVFALCGLGIGFGAEPVLPSVTAQALVDAPKSETEVEAGSGAAMPSRRAWREQLPAIIVIRRAARPS